MRFAISYVSTATPNLSDAEIQELMDFVKIHNNANQITGVLMYSDGNFFQVLEGEKNVIQELFAKIKKDPRHYDVIQIISNQIAERNFSEYHSSFTTIKDSTSHAELYKFLKNEEANNPENYKSISYLATKFMNLS